MEKKRMSNNDLSKISGGAKDDYPAQKFNVNDRVHIEKGIDIASHSKITGDGVITEAIFCEGCGSREKGIWRYNIDLDKEVKKRKKATRIAEEYLTLIS